MGQAGREVSEVAEANPNGLECMGVAFGGVITDSPVDPCSLTLRSITSAGVETTVAQVPLNLRVCIFRGGEMMPS